MAPIRRRPKEFTQAQKNKWSKRYLEGESSHKIARSEDTSSNAVLLELKNQNIPIRPPGICHRKKNTLGEKAYNLRKQNLSWSEIGKEVTARHKTHKYSASYACSLARGFAKVRELPWPI